MLRNLDMTSLRSFVAVADTGGVTRAAGFMNLTQSAVSMQLKRLEEALEVQLIDRSSRSVGLTTAGEKLLSYARRMLELNDEVYTSLTHDEFEGEIVLGIPHDIVYPALPKVLQRFNSEYPRVRVNLISSYTKELRDLYAKGRCDLILTTEERPDAGGMALSVAPLVWIGAPGGNAWKARPLRLAFENNCIFRTDVQKALDSAAIPWEMAVESNSTRTIEATVSADLAIHAVIAGHEPPYVERIAHGGALPELNKTGINLYGADLVRGRPAQDLAGFLSQAYKAG
ncbi:MAG: LysR family transcriptional regulator [Pseudomonadota bacterium]